MTEIDRLRKGLPPRQKSFLRRIVGEELDGEAIRPVLSCGHHAPSAPPDDPRRARLCILCRRHEPPHPINPETIARRFARISAP